MKYNNSPEAIQFTNTVFQNNWNAMDWDLFDNLAQTSARPTDVFGFITYELLLYTSLVDQHMKYLLDSSSFTKTL